MLVLQRSVGESIMIGDDIEATVVDVGGDWVALNVIGTANESRYIIRLGEEISISDGIKVVMVRARKYPCVRLGVTAPRAVRVDRKEIWEAKQREKVR